VITASLLVFLSCPPTAVPNTRADGGHYLASPYGGAGKLQPTDTAAQMAPEPSDLPLWDLDATRAEVEARLSEDAPPEWAHWVAWTLDRAQGRGTGRGHLVAALSTDALTAERLGWWRAITAIDIDARDVLLDAFERARAPSTRALLAAALALVEYERSCPIAVATDGACRVPGSTSLMRRQAITLERARYWAKLGAELRENIRDDSPSIANAALFAELELARMVEDYESMLVADYPDDLDFVVEDYLRDSGVREWEAEYARQVARSRASKARARAFWTSYHDCSGEMLERHYPLMWTDSHSTGVILLRNARILLTFIVNLETASERVTGLIVHGPVWKSRGHVGRSQTDPLEDQAHDYLSRCLELTTTVSFDAELDDACAQLHEYAEPAPVEFVLTPSTRTVMHSYPVAAL
jgi:hypothetical protein